MKLEIFGEGTDDWYISARRGRFDMSDPALVENKRRQLRLTRKRDELFAHPPKDQYAFLEQSGRLIIEHNRVIVEYSAILLEKAIKERPEI